MFIPFDSVISLSKIHPKKRIKNIGIKLRDITLLI